MDFMKVFDQTVREIKREVNLKVLKVPEIEQKVLDATSDEPWGPHGSDLAEIARETKKLTECQMIMSVLWTRLADTGANWRHAYKALAVIEYLIANGSDRAVDDIVEHTFQISSLTGFEYVEPNGKDMGINVRKKAETISGLLNDRDKIKTVRDKAAATRDKYVGLSSSGVTYKSSAASFGSSSFSQYDRHAGRSTSREGERLSDSYKDKYQIAGEMKTDDSHENDGKKQKNEIGRRIRINDPSSSSLKEASLQDPGLVSKNSNAKMGSPEDDFDDFDPRGSSGAGLNSASFKQGDPFGGSLLIDLMDEPSTASSHANASTATAVETDLFADAAFISAPTEAKTVLPTQEVNLFAHQAAPVSSNVNLFDTLGTAATSTIEPVQSKFIKSGGSDPFATVPLTAPASTIPLQSEATKSSSFDPFSAVPLNTFDESDFGAFTSHAGSVNPASLQDPVSASLGNQNSSIMPKQAPKNNTFQVKSGIWADSLSRGLIDLNITAPKKVSLADIGIMGDLDDPTEEKEKSLLGSLYMGKAMGSGAGLGWSAFPSSGGSGSGNFPTQQQWGNFK